MKIILADDHALFRDGFVLLLLQHAPDVQCFTARSFDEAMALLESHPDTDLLMLDLNMPGMRGVTSVQAVLRAHPGLPLSILSGEESREQMEALLRAGASGYIPKAASSPVMISAIRLMLAGGGYVPPQVLARESGAQIEQSDRRAGGEDRRADSVMRPESSIAIQLSPRQQDILRLLAEGKPNKLICRELDISEGTVKTHLNAIFRVLGVENRTEAAVKARLAGLLG
jgi:DNA-binding NarL/FixJ family response regulator